MYTKPEVIEIGEATEVILGVKDTGVLDDIEEARLPDSDLD